MPRKRYSKLGDVLYNDGISEIAVVVSVDRKANLQWLDHGKGRFSQAPVDAPLHDYVVNLGPLAPTPDNKGTP